MATTNPDKNMLAQEGLSLETGTFVNSRKQFIIVTRFLTLAIVAVLAGREADPEHLKTIYTLLFVFLLSNVFFMFQPAQKFDTERISGWIFVFDTFFVSTFVFYLQARTTEFYLIYFLTIFISASAKSTSAAIATSLVTAIIYGLLTKYGKTGIELRSISFFVRTIFFFVTAMVVGYFAEQVKKEREARETAQRMLHLSNRLAALFDVSKKMVSTDDLGHLAHNVFDSAVRVLGGDSGSLMLLDEATGRLTIKESVGLCPEARSQDISLGEGIAGVVAKEGNAALLMGDISDDPQYSSLATGRHISSAVCAPLTIGSRALGVINVNRSPEKPPFTNEDLQLLVALANHAAIVLEKVKLHERLAQAYDASKLRYETLVNAANAMIFVTDASGVLTFINQQGAQMLDCCLSEIEGKPIFEFIHPQDIPKFKTALQEVTQRREVAAHLEYRVKPKRADWRQHSASCAFLEDKTRGECGLLGVAEDVTDYVLLQRRLAQSAKLASVGTMISGIAHELNNPLVGVIGFAEILKEREDIRNLAGPELDMILQQAERCVQTVRGLLKFAREEETTKKPIDINQILRESLNLRRHEMAVQNIRLVEEYEENLPMTAADSSQIEQVFLNIISNAFDAMSETHGGGTLSVRTFQRNSTISIEFVDDGGGVHDPEKIFDPFYTTKEVGKGTGLGLSISYGIIEEHRGQIEVRNNEKGAVFTVSLPIVEVKTNGELSTANKETPLGHASVLVIDDEEVVLQISRKILEGMGYAVTTAQTVAEALNGLNENHYDVILTDIRLPGPMDGRAFYEWAKLNRPDVAERIVFTTGDTLSPEIQKFIRQTGVDCLTKPFRQRAFKEIVQRALQAHSTYFPPIEASQLEVRGVISTASKISDGSSPQHYCRPLMSSDDGPR